MSNLIFYISFGITTSSFSLYYSLRWMWFIAGFFHPFSPCPDCLPKSHALCLTHLLSSPESLPLPSVRHQLLVPLSRHSRVVPTFTNILARLRYLELLTTARSPLQLLPIQVFLSGTSQEARKRILLHSETLLWHSLTGTQLLPPCLWQPTMIKLQTPITWSLYIHRFLPALLREHHLRFQIRGIAACHLPTRKEAR